MMKIMNQCLNWQGSKKPLLRLAGQVGMELMIPYARKIERETEKCSGDEKIMLEAKEKIRNKIMEEIGAL